MICITVCTIVYRDTNITDEINFIMCTGLNMRSVLIHWLCTLESQYANQTINTCM